MFIYSITVEKTQERYFDLCIFVYRHNPNDTNLVTLHDAVLCTRENYDLEMSTMLHRNPEVSAVLHEKELDFPDEISVKEAADCLFWDIIKGK